MPDNAVIRERIEAAEAELAAAKAELATPEYDPDALYAIDSSIGRYLARGVVSDRSGLNLARYAAINGDGLSRYLEDPIRNGLIFHRQVKLVTKVNV